MLHELTKTVLLIVTTLFPIINPPAAGFIILSMVPRASSGERAHLARRVTVNSLIVLVASLSVGAYVLSFFGISVPVLRVAGGTIIAISGWKLLQLSGAEAANHDKTDLHLERTPDIEARSFFPLTLPITVGPGAISVAIALGTGSPLTGLRPVHLLGVGIAVGLLCCSIYLSVRFAASVEKLLGPSRTTVSMKLFAFAIFCIGTQIAWIGMYDLFKTLLAP